MTVQWKITLTSGAIRNGNISFKKCPFSISPDFIGGTNSGTPAAKTISVNFDPGSVSQQWLYSDKMIFANRNPHTKDFFTRISASEGTEILITKTSNDAITIQKV